MTKTAILNYNGQALLQKFLPAVFRYRSGASVFVADNHSSDGSADFVAAEFPEAILIRIPENRGFCGGYNFALAQVDADYFVLLNSDVEVTEGWLDPIVNHFDKNPRLGAAQPKILSYHQRDYFEYAGAAGGFLDSLGYPFCRGRIFHHLEKDQGQYDDARPAFWATGACLFIRASLFKKLGGLDEDYFAHMEEIDLCWKLKRDGSEVYCHGDSHVFHVGGGTLDASNPRKTYLNFRNGLSLIFKHLPFAQLIWKMPMRLMLDWVASFKFLFEGSAGDFLAVWKAHFNFLTGLNREFSKRKKLTRQLPDSGTRHLYTGLIVADFYLLRRKVFSQLGIQ